MKRQRIAASSKQSPPDHEASTFKHLGIGLALADNRNQVTTSATTTKHPQHRPRCTCIACVHPPSSGGLTHKPACMCNVCIAVNRRFAKRKQQFEQEEPESQKRLSRVSDKETEADSSLKHVRPLDPFRENVTEKLEVCKGSLDLDCHLGYEDDTRSGVARVSMMSLFQGIVHPLGAYLKQDGLASLPCDQQTSSNVQILPQVSGERQGRTRDESLSSAIRELRIVDADEEMKRHRIFASSKQSPPDHEASTFKHLGIGLALADNRNQVTTSATTTKHPQHRPRCTCIACVHPPSSGGLTHKPACRCNVCIAVNRRFAKRKQPFEQEELESQKRLSRGSDKETEADSSLKHVRPLDPFRENVTEKLEVCKGSLDLDCHLGYEDDTRSGVVRVSMMSLFQGIVHPLGTYLKQDGLASLDQQTASNIQILPQFSGERQQRTRDESLASAIQELRIVDADEDEGSHRPDQVQNDGA